MKRHTPIRLTILFLIFISGISLYANENFADSIRLGHPDESYDIYDKLNNPDKDLNLKRAAAIYIPASKIKLYKGNSITAVRFALAPNIFFTELSIFVTKDLNQPYTYKQPVSTRQKTGWNSVRLDTLYKINTDEGIYIEYEYKSSNNLVGKLTSTEDTSMDWVYKDGSWIPSSDIHDHALAIQGVVKGDQLPRYNIALQQTKIPVFVKLGENATISGTFTNEATAQTIQIIDLPSVGGTPTALETYEADFKVPADGKYYLGFHCYSFEDIDAEKYTYELQASNVKLNETTTPPDNIDLNSMDDTTVYAIDGKIYINGEYTSATVYNQLGTVCSTNAALATGIYFVKVMNGNASKTYKVFIK